MNVYNFKRFHNEELSCKFQYKLMYNGCYILLKFFYVNRAHVCLLMRHLSSFKYSETLQLIIRTINQIFCPICLNQKIMHQTLFMHTRYGIMYNAT